MPEESKSLAEIEAHRAKIDEIDQQIVVLLNKRAGHSLVIRGLKPGARMGLYDPKRGEEIFARVNSYNEDLCITRTSEKSTRQFSRL